MKHFLLYTPYFSGGHDQHETHCKVRGTVEVMGSGLKFVARLSGCRYAVRYYMCIYMYNVDPAILQGCM